MVKSLFLFPSTNPAFNRAQIRKLRDEFGPKALLCEGPFSDWRGGVKKLIRHVKSHSCSQSRLAGVLGTLSPQNLPECLRMTDSRLKVPFVFGEMAPDISNPRDCAGVIACSDPIEDGKKKARVADFEELTMLGVALLRSFGIESYFSMITLIRNQMDVPNTYPHADIVLANRPCIMLPDDDQLNLAMFMPPFYTPCSEDTPIQYIEVLDSQALEAILKMKLAKSYAEALMDCISSRSPEFEGEGMLRSMQIGHMLYEGADQWTLPEAQESILLASEMFGPRKTSSITSMRELAEDEFVHKIECPSCHLTKAANIMLCDKAKTSIIESILQASSLDEVFGLIEPFQDHDCIAKFVIYISFAVNINFHTHNPSECTDGKGEN
jgi:hypothetical protein